MHQQEDRASSDCGNNVTRFSSVQSLSCVRLFATPWIAARQASLSITSPRSSLRLTSIESVVHPAISSSVVPFSSCPQSLPASGSFPMSQLFAWDGQSTGVSALASFLPKKFQGWSPSEWTGSSCSPRDSQESSPTPQLKASILGSSAYFMVQLISVYDYQKTIALTRPLLANLAILCFWLQW